MLFSALRVVFLKTKYLILALVIAIGIFILATWLPNFNLVSKIISSNTIGFTDKVGVLFKLIGSIQTNFSLFSAVFTILIALLFGINISMITYYIRSRRQMAGGSVGAGIGGVISGVFGIGCAACGSLLIAPLLSLIGAGGLIAFLPLNGQEFGIIGIIALSISIYLIAKRIEAPLVC